MLLCVCVCVRVCAYLDGHQCVNSMSKEEFSEYSWPFSNPEVQKTNSKVTLIREDRILHTHTHTHTIIYCHVVFFPGFPWSQTVAQLENKSGFLICSWNSSDSMETVIPEGQFV